MIVISSITFIFGIGVAWTIQKSDISYLKKDVFELKNCYSDLSEKMRSVENLTIENNTYLKMILKKYKE